MAHDVFISYAAEDHEVAGEVCRALEEHGVKCWIAPRDVPYGTDYEDAIVDAISASPLLVLILSARSNSSPHVKREIQNACAEGSTTRIIPLRIEDIPYSKGLQYYLRSTQWLDASTPPLEQHLRRLVEHVRTHLSQLDQTAETATPPRAPSPPSDASAAEPKVASDAQPVRDDSRRKGRAGWLAGGAVALLAVVVIAVVAFRSINGGGNADSPVGGGLPIGGGPTPIGGGVSNSPTPPRHTASPSPTPAASPTPTPTPSPQSTPPRNYNVRLPVNAILRRPGDTTVKRTPP
jgi:TIR domain